MDYKKILTRVTVAFVALLLILTFFSRTIADITVPRVMLEFAPSRAISPVARGAGIVRPADVERVFSPVTGRVTQVLRPGETANAQTVLFTVSADLRALTDAYARAAHDLRLAEMNYERTTSELATERAQLAGAGGQAAALREYDLQIEAANAAFERASAASATEYETLSAELEIQRILYAQGVVPRQQLTDMENRLAGVASALDLLTANHLQNMEQLQIRRSRAAQNHTAALDARRGRISQLEFTLITLEMDLERINENMEDLAEQIENDGIVEVRVPGGARVVSELLSGIAVGAQVNEGMAVMDTALANNRFYIEVFFAQALDFISVGQIADVTIATDTIDGQVGRVLPQGGRNLVAIELTGGGLRGGEMAQVSVRGGTTNHANVVPLTALREDQQGYYILWVESVPRGVGSSYYLRPLRVEPGRRDATHVAITPMWGQEMPVGGIVVNSDVPVHAGTRVRIVG
jgi:multidrug resistance efflux pump